MLIDLFFSSDPVPHLDVSAAFGHPLTADEMTVGKVYAALMIFDFYKQNKNSREQVHQPPGGLCQVPSQKVSSLILPPGQPLLLYGWKSLLHKTSSDIWQSKSDSQKWPAPQPAHGWGTPKEFFGTPRSH